MSHTTTIKTTAPVLWLALLILAYLSVLVFASLCPPLTKAKAQEMPGKYRVVISDNPLTATIEARIPVKDGRLFMAPWGADQLPNGWATFVRGFRVLDESNKQLTFESKPNGVWMLTNGFNGTAKVSYQVDLSFTQSKWPAGNEQAGTFQDDALFIVSKSLFVISDVAGQRELRFELPASWKIATPWQLSSSGPHVFVAKDNNDLIDNSLVTGKYFEDVFTEGNFTFNLALLGNMAKAKDLIAPALHKVVQSYIRMFDKTPPSKYLITVFYADDADAEAFAGSAAFTERDTLTKNNLIRWGNTLAHEFFHFWNGHAIRGDDYASSQWFAEGFTEYFANLALVQQGVISRELFIKKMEHHFGLYLYFKSSPAFDGATLKEAGSKKGRYRLGVYDGGWSVAFCLDLVIRDATQNRRSVVDLMRLLYQRFGLSGKKYRYEDVVSAAAETAGRNVSDFFRRYVEGRETLPVQEYLKRIGLEGYTQFYDGEFFIFDADTASAEQKALQQSILTRPE
jgi:predicted metalloprotease with PDZ domain